MHELASIISLSFVVVGFVIYMYCYALFILHGCSVQEKEGEGAPSTGVGSKASSQKKAASKQRKGGGISKSKSLESDANSFTEEDTAPLLLN